MIAALIILGIVGVYSAAVISIRAVLLWRAARNLDSLGG